MYHAQCAQRQTDEEHRRPTASTQGRRGGCQGIHVWEGVSQGACRAMDVMSGKKSSPKDHKESARARALQRPHHVEPSLNPRRGGTHGGSGQDAPSGIARRSAPRRDSTSGFSAASASRAILPETLVCAGSAMFLERAERSACSRGLRLFMGANRSDKRTLLAFYTMYFLLASWRFAVEHRHTTLCRSLYPVFML